jgi:ankyrin repeat protein
MATELFAAIEKHDLNAIAALLSHGADPNVVRPEAPEWLPLHAAIEELEHGGPIEAIVLLLRHGAAVDGLTAMRDATPLLMALFRNQPEAVRMLLAAGADPNVEGAEGDSPLRWSVAHNDHETAAMLLRCGAAVTIDSAGGPSGMSALGRAAHRLNIPMIELLLDAGADPEALDCDLRTARERLPARESDPEACHAANALLEHRSSGAQNANTQGEVPGK